MKLTKKEKDIMTNGTFISKHILIIKHYGDEEWIEEAIKFVEQLKED